MRGPGIRSGAKLEAVGPLLARVRPLGAIFITLLLFAPMAHASNDGYSGAGVGEYRDNYGPVQSCPVAIEVSALQREDNASRWDVSLILVPVANTRETFDCLLPDAGTWQNLPGSPQAGWKFDSGSGGCGREIMQIGRIPVAGTTPVSLSRSFCGNYRVESYTGVVVFAQSEYRQVEDLALSLG